MFPGHAWLKHIRDGIEDSAAAIDGSIVAIEGTVGGNPQKVLVPQQSRWSVNIDFFSELGHPMRSDRTSKTNIR